MLNLRARSNSPSKEQKQNKALEARLSKLEEMITGTNVTAQVALDVVTKIQKAGGVGKNLIINM